MEPLSAREGFYGDSRISRRGDKRGNSPIKVPAILVLVLILILSPVVIRVAVPGPQGSWSVRATDTQALENWTYYVFHMDPENQTQMNFTKVVFGLQHDSVIFDGTFAEYLHNQSVAENLSALVNNYTYFFDNASGGGHWLAKEVAAGAVNGTMLKTAMRIYALHPELLHDMDFIFYLSQTKNFQDGFNDTDKQILANEVNAWENLQPFEKRFLLMFPVNATSYTKTPGDLLYSLFSYYANQWGIDPSNATQAKILLTYAGVYDGFYAIKHVGNGESETQFLDNYILKQAPAIGIDYLKKLAQLKSGVIGLSFAINPAPSSYITGIWKDAKSSEALNGVQYEKAFIWLNETPRGYPNAYADARAFWNEQNLNETAIKNVYTGKIDKVGSNSQYSNPIDSLATWVYSMLHDPNATGDDPGPDTFNDLYMKYYLNLTKGQKMLLDCSGFSPLVWYLTVSQTYLFVRYNNTLTNDSKDPNIFAPFKVENVAVYDHVGSTAIGWNTTASEIGFGNSWNVMDQLKNNEYMYYTKFPTFPRYMVRAKFANANTIYYNIPGISYPPLYNRPGIKMITNITTLSKLQRETFGAMIDNDYNNPYGSSYNPDGNQPYEKYKLTGSEFPPIYRAIPTDERVSGEPNVAPEVPELNWLVIAVPVIYIVMRFGRVKGRRKR